MNIPIAGDNGDIFSWTRISPHYFLLKANERRTAMTEEKQEGGFWDRISNINKTTVCDNCGHENERGAVDCAECHTPLPEGDEDEEAINTFIGEGPLSSQQFRKVPIRDAKNLINLRKACEGVESGAMSADEYRQIVKKLNNMTQMGVNLFKSDVVKKKTEALPENEIALVHETQTEIFRYHEGVSRMMKYLETGNVSDAREGFNIAEEALRNMDRIQDKAIEIAAAL